MDGNKGVDALPDVDPQKLECMSERYPFYDVKKIPWNPPAAYFQPKKVFEKEPDEEPYIKPPSRKVQKELLSPSQKPLYGKSLFEKDLVILRDREEKREIEKQKGKKSPGPQLPPSLYFREDRERRRKRDTEMEQHQEEIARMIRREKKWKRKVMADRERVKAAIQARKEEKENEEEWAHKQRINELIERAKKAAALEAEFEGERPTRASSLKFLMAQRASDKEIIEYRRMRLNAELRKEKSRKIRKKLTPVMDRMNQDVFAKNSASKRRQEMQQTERQWQEWLDLTEKTNAKRKSLVERVQYQCDAEGRMLLPK